MYFLFPSSWYCIMLKPIGSLNNFSTNSRVDGDFGSHYVHVPSLWWDIYIWYPFNIAGTSIAVGRANVEPIVEPRSGGFPDGSASPNLAQCRVSVVDPRPLFTER